MPGSASLPGTQLQIQQVNPLKGGAVLSTYPRQSSVGLKVDLISMVCFLLLVQGLIHLQTCSIKQRVCCKGSSDTFVLWLGGALTHSPGWGSTPHLSD